MPGGWGRWTVHERVPGKRKMRLANGVSRSNQQGTHGSAGGWGGGEVEMWFAWKKPRDERGAPVRIQ